MYKLANVGVDIREKNLDCGSSQRPKHPLFLECMRMEKKEDIFLDGVLWQS